MADNLFERAVAFAMKAHEGQTRKDGGIYILHPLEDAVICGTMTNDEEVLAAAVLHDTVEDTDVTMEELVANFGERVAELVGHETEDKREGINPSDTWKIRKLESIEALKNSDGIEVKILWLGDKLSNMRSLSRDHEKLGDAVFERFNEKNPAEQRWYHQTIIDNLSELSDTPAYREYVRLFHKVFG